jgi:hypothetical protein
MAASTRETRISLIYNNGHGEYDRVYLPRAGVVNAAIGAAAENVERVLAVDPDIILLLGTAELPRQFMRDQRWLGLKAVREKRVYIDPWNSTWGPGGLTFRPVELRWIAELAHPDRLQPKVRQLLRDRMFGEFGYRLSDRQIDLQLRVADNSASLGAERFTRDYQVVGKRGF